MNHVSLPSLLHPLEDLELLTRRLAPACTAEAPPTLVTFEQCTFVTPAAVAYLGALLRLAAIRRAPLTVAWATLPEKPRHYLAQTGFLAHHGQGSATHPGHAVPYREDTLGELAPDLPRYLDSAWLNHPWLRLAAPQRRLIISRLLEIYSNACDHSESPVGIFTAGQHYPRSRHVLFTMVDVGKSIPTSVQEFLNDPTLTPWCALEWAFERGHTTRPSRPRGLGLDLLAMFVRANDGRLDLVSGQAHMQITATSTECYSLPYAFPGTAVSISLRCGRDLYTASPLHSPALAMSSGGPPPTLSPRPLSPTKER